MKYSKDQLQKIKNETIEVLNNNYDIQEHLNEMINSMQESEIITREQAAILSTLGVLKVSYENSMLTNDEVDFINEILNKEE